MIPKTNQQFFQSTHPIFHHLFHIFIKGDLVLLPFLILIILTGFISAKVMFISYGVYLSVRYTGEILYWLLQQFGDRKYRPNRAFTPFVL